MTVVSDEWEPPKGKPIVAHIARERLPWETTDLTECGKDPTQFVRVVSREAALRRFKEVGSTRARYEFCVTCVQTANRHPTWSNDPIAAVGRVTTYGWRADDANALHQAELRAVAHLIEAHRAEFEQAVGDLMATISADAFRRAKQRRRGMTP